MSLIETNTATTADRSRRIMIAGEKINGEFPLPRAKKKVIGRPTFLTVNHMLEEIFENAARI